MEYFIGVALAILLSVGATVVGFDRDRAMYPLLIVVIALLYALFAVMGGSHEALLWELLPIVLFLVAAVLGFRRSLWWAVLALAAHGVFDFVHAGLIDNPGVPSWWPMFCASYDLVAAAYLAWLLRSGRLDVAPVASFPLESDSNAVAGAPCSPSSPPASTVTRAPSTGRPPRC
jgi:hypothetical protein